MKKKEFLKNYLNATSPTGMEALEDNFGRETSSKLSVHLLTHVYGLNLLMKN